MTISWYFLSPCRLVFPAHLLPPLPSVAPALPAKRPSFSLLSTPPVPSSASPSPHSPLPLSPFSFSPQASHPPASNPAAASSSPSDVLELPPIKLYSTREQRDLCEQLADLYSLLLTIEHLETAYVRDAIPDTKDYTHTCNRLLAQYKTLHESLGKEAPDLTHFCHSLAIHANKAIARIRVGVPATTLHGGGSMSDVAGGSSLVFRAAQSYITLLDALKLGMRAVDQLVPLLTDAMSAVNQVSDMPAEHEARVGVRQWLVLLSGMRAHEELTAEQARQCEFDM